MMRRRHKQAPERASRRFEASGLYFVRYRSGPLLPMIQYLLFSLLLALGAWSAALPAYAHNIENIEGSPEGKPLAPHITEQPPLLFDAQTRAILENPLDRDCNELRALSSDAKHFLLDRAVSFQTPGMLRLIIGTDCPLFGEVTPIAEIRDPSLLIGKTSFGTLYHVSSLKLLFVTNPENESVAYALESSGTGSAVTQFLSQRSEAERLVVIGNSLYTALEPLRLSSSSEQRTSRAASVGQSTVSSVAPPGAASSTGTMPTQTQSARSAPQDGAQGTSQLQTSTASQEISDDTMETSSLSSREEELPVILRELDPEETKAGNIPIVAIVIAVITIALLVIVIIRTIMKNRVEPSSASPKTDREDDINPEA